MNFLLKINFWLWNTLYMKLLLHMAFKGKRLFFILCTLFYKTSDLVFTLFIKFSITSPIFIEIR